MLGILVRVVIPAGRIVPIWIPQAAEGLGASRVLRVVCRQEDLLLDDEWDLSTTLLDEIGHSAGYQAALEVVPEYQCAGDARIGVEPGDADGMVVVPEQTRRLVERVVDLGLADVQVGIDDPVDVEASVRGARAVEGPGVEEAVARSEPSKGSAVARPRHQAAVHVHACAVAGTSGTHQTRVDRHDVGVGQLVVERDLDRLAPLTDDDPAEVTLRRRAAQIRDRLESPQRGRRQRWVQSVLVLGDIDRVVVDHEPAVEVLARTVGDSHWDPAWIERINAAKGLQEPRRRWALDKNGVRRGQARDRCGKRLGDAPGGQHVPSRSP